MQQGCIKMVGISIHAPRTGSDTISDAPRGGGSIFQSTLPARGATVLPETQRAASRVISIHAPRTGSDTIRIYGAHHNGNFNPRSPHGERRKAGRENGRSLHFNPRSPHGERRNPFIQRRFRRNFNPRSPHGERRVSPFESRRASNFNPRSPHGERRLVSYHFV